MHFVGVASPSVDFKERRLSFIIWGHIIQSAERLRAELRFLFWDGKKFCHWMTASALVLVFNLLAHDTDFRLASPWFFPHLSPFLPPSFLSPFPPFLTSFHPSFNLSSSNWFSFSGRTLIDADFGSKSGSRGLESWIWASELSRGSLELVL